jgi:hypothetical protein
LFDPVRRHLLPLVNAPIGAATRPEPGASGALPNRAQALREIADLNLGRDLREIVLSRTSSGAWALALGGVFPESGVARGVEAVLRREGVRTLERLGDELLLSSGGIAIGQAPDGVIVVASSRETLQSALLGTDEADDETEQLRLPLDGDGGFALGDAALRGWLGSAATAAAPTASGGLYGRLHLERPLRLEAWLGRGEAAAARELIAAAQQALSFESGDALRAPVADSGAERALLARARVQAAPPNSPGTIVTYLELSELDTTLAWIANRVERELMPPGPEG